MCGGIYLYISVLSPNPFQQILFGPQLKEHPLRSKQVLKGLLVSQTLCGEGLFSVCVVLLGEFNVSQKFHNLIHTKIWNETKI